MQWKNFTPRAKPKKMNGHPFWWSQMNLIPFRFHTVFAAILRSSGTPNSLLTAVKEGGA
jgi:hypothetical protein